MKIQFPLELKCNGEDFLTGKYYKLQDNNEQLIMRFCASSGIESFKNLIKDINDNYSINTSLGLNI